MLYIRGPVEGEDFVYALTDGKNILKEYTEKDEPINVDEEIKKYKDEQRALQLDLMDNYLLDLDFRISTVELGL